MSERDYSKMTAEQIQAELDQGLPEFPAAPEAEGTPAAPKKLDDPGWGTRMLQGLGLAAGSTLLPLLTRFRVKPWAVPETENLANLFRSRGVMPSVADLAPQKGFMRPIPPSEPAAYRTPFSARVQEAFEQAGEPTTVAMRRMQRQQMLGATGDALSGIEPPFYRPGNLGQEITFRLTQENKARKKTVDELWDELRNTAATSGLYKKLPNVMPVRTYDAVRELMRVYPDILSEIKPAPVKDALKIIAEANPTDIGGGLPYIYSEAVHGPQIPKGTRVGATAGFEDLRKHIGAAKRALYGKPETADQARMLGDVQKAIYFDLADWGAASSNRKIKRLSEDAINEYKNLLVPYKESDEASRILRGQVPEEDVVKTVLRRPSTAAEVSPLLGPGGQDVLGYAAAQRALTAPGWQVGERPTALTHQLSKEDDLLKTLLSPNDYSRVAPLAQIAETLPNVLPTDAFRNAQGWKHPLTFLGSKLPGAGLVSRGMYSPTIQNLLFRETDPWAQWVGRGGLAGGLGAAGYSGFQKLTE